MTFKMRTSLARDILERRKREKKMLSAKKKLTIAGAYHFLLLSLFSEHLTLFFYD